MAVAVDGYIERDANSKFKYCDGIEALVRDQNSLLLINLEKINSSLDIPADKKLALKKHLQEVHDDINRLCYQTSIFQNPDTLKSKTIGILEKAVKNFPEYHYNSYSTLLQNFLLAITGVGLGYLYLTQGTRQTFWLTEKVSDQALAPFKENLENSSEMNFEIKCC